MDWNFFLFLMTERGVFVEPLITVDLQELLLPTDKKVLHHIHLNIYKGDFIVIAGGSASGKSMLLHGITGAAEKHFRGTLKGSVCIDGVDIRSIPLPLMCEKVGFMMQTPQNQITCNKVGDEVGFALANKNVPWVEIQRKVRQVLDFVGMTSYEERKVDELSGGQAQRIVFASILSMDAPILLLDQPTAELDPQGRKEWYGHLKHLNRTKETTVVMVMDRAGEVLPFANRVLIMEGGTIVKECTPKEYEAHRLYRCSRQNKRKLHYTKSILKVQDAAYTYKNGQLGCTNVNLELQQGEFVGLVGHNGSGKTTLIKLMMGLLWPQKGEIFFLDQKIHKKNIVEARKKMGFVFQNPDMQIFSNTLRDEVGFALKQRGMDSKDINRRVRALLDLVELPLDLDVHPQILSRSQRQKLVIASALAGDPDLLIADEPTSGLDEDQSALIMDVLARCQQQGKTILVVSHDLDQIQVYADRILQMKDHHLIDQILITETDQEREGKVG